MSCLAYKLNTDVFFPLLLNKRVRTRKILRQLFQNGFIFPHFYNEDVSLYDSTFIKARPIRFLNMGRYYFPNYFPAQTSKEMSKFTRV